jgi:hypothetical protein
MPLSDNDCNQLLDSMLGSDHSNRYPATVYWACYTVAPDADGTGGTEGYGGAATTYARVAQSNNDTNFPDAVDGEKTNATQVDFPTPDGDTDDIVAFALHRHATNDDVICWEVLESPFGAGAGEPILIEVGEFIGTIPQGG